MKTVRSKSILCLPGLGGHQSVFEGYTNLLPEFELKSVELVNRHQALRDARTVLAAEDQPMILFCNCYSAQMAIRLANEMPDKVSQLVLLEPFFVEFHSWLQPLRSVALILREASRLSGWLGLRRRQFSYQPDYKELSKYPIFVQPLFDMRWQGLTDYFDKCYDILTYKLPPRVDTPTLMIFSSHGFSRDATTHAQLQTIFTQGKVTILENGSHNVLTIGADHIASTVREFLSLPSSI